MREIPHQPGIEPRHLPRQPETKAGSSNTPCQSSSFGRVDIILAYCSVAVYDELFDDYRVGGDVGGETIDLILDFLDNH